MILLNKEVSTADTVDTSKSTYTKTNLQRYFVNYKQILLLDILQELNIAVPDYKQGKFKISCVFHQEKTPSLLINIKSNTFYCFGCNRHGNNLQFVMDFLNLDFNEALQWLSERFPRHATISQYVPNKMMYVLRSISNDRSTQRYLVFDQPSRLHLRDAYYDDIIAIRDILSKSYSPLTFKISGAKICVGLDSSFLKWKQEFSYSIAMPINNGMFYFYNPKQNSIAIHCEGLTDFLTAIEMRLYEYYCVIGDHSKTIQWLDDYEEHLFLLDEDVSISEFKLNLLKKIKRTIVCKFIKLPGYSDLSDFHTFCHDEDIFEIINHAKYIVLNPQQSLYGKVV